MNKSVFKFLYYFLSFTWGILTNIVGAVMALALIITGHKPKRYAGDIYFEIGSNWGGFSYGIFFIVDKDSSEYLKYHEYGHSLQNCIYGPFMSFIVNAPSTCRYWYRRIREKRNHPCKTDYYTIWFEKQASSWGKYFSEKYYSDQNS